MSTKKNTGAKKINTETEKIAAPIRLVIKRIDHSLNEQVKECNVPVFKVLEKAITTEGFFRNHVDFMAILGKENIEILDRMVMHAICEDLSNSLYEDIHDTKGYVGVWDHNTIYNIIAAVVTFMKHDTTVETYFTAKQFAVISDEDLQKLAKNTYMAFSEYNPNRFFEICMQIRLVAVDVIQGIMKEKIPTAFVHTNNITLGARLTETYRSYMHDDITAAIEKICAECNCTSDDINTMMSSETAVQIFTKYFEKPFLTMMTITLQNSGLSENVINLMLGSSRIHILYDDPTKVKFVDTTINYRFVSELNNRVNVTFTTKIGDVLTVALSDLETMAKTRKENYGKAIRKLILELCQYSANTYMETIRLNKQAKENEENASENTEEIDDLLNDVN